MFAPLSSSFFATKRVVLSPFTFVLLIDFSLWHTHTDTHSLLTHSQGSWNLYPFVQVKLNLVFDLQSKRRKERKEQRTIVNLIKGCCYVYKGQIVMREGCNEISMEINFFLRKRGNFI